METITANKAKTNFGELLMKVQQEPVCILKHGKPVAVMVSMEYYETIKSMKVTMLQDKIKIAKEETKK